MRIIFANTLLEMAKRDERICFITPDMGYSIIDNFQNTYPDRYFNLGIAEQNVIAVAAGMALHGFKPYVYSVIPFIVHRCLEQIRVNVSYMNSDIKIIGIGSGFEYGIAGATHHGTEDISIMRSLPNIEIFAPADEFEIAEITRQTAINNKPTYIRIGRHNKGRFNNNSTLDLYKASVIKDGDNIAFIATGNMVHVALDLANNLKVKNKNPKVISIHTLKPVDKECILNLINEGYEIYTFEEHTIMGGLGSIVAEIIAQSGKCVKFKMFGINDEYCDLVGNATYIREKYKLDYKGLLKCF